MNSLLLEILYYIFGGFILANLSLIIFQLFSLHPYSKPTIPVVVQSFFIFISALVVNSLNDDLETIADAIRFSLVEGILGFIVIIPFLYILMIYFLFKASFRKRHFDDLLDASE
tara:strand:+ start:1210 stop:1551 length:342 start_codon:yes stop_codon:yes gene_type:complete